MPRCRRFDERNPALAKRLYEKEVTSVSKTNVGNSQAPSRNNVRDGCPISYSDKVEVRRIRRAMPDLGYRPLAIHSPWSLAVGEASAGKQPLTEVVNGQKIPWRQGHSRERLMRISALSANTGLLLGGGAALISLDIDPSKTAAPCEQQAFAMAALKQIWSGALGVGSRQALVRLRSPGSMLLLLRAGAPMSKIKVQGERGAVELLGEGQQCLVHGWHPRSRSGVPVRWTWHGDRAPWIVPVTDLPVVPASEIEAMMRRIAASGVLGAPRERAASAAAAPRHAGGSAYPATARLNALFEKHDGLVRPAVRELVEQIGAEGTGRHDAVVAICGRLVMQRWADEQAVGFLAPLVNERFGDGDWTAEIEAAIAHAHRREAQRLSGARRAS